MDQKEINAAFRNVERKQNASLAKKLADNPELVNATDVLGYTLLHKAVGGRNWEALDMLLRLGADPNRLEPHNGISAMQIAVRDADREGVERLLAAGADIDVRDSYGNEPIVNLFQTQFLDAKTIEEFYFFLVDHGASLASAHEILRLAAGKGALGVMRHLLDHVLTDYPDAAPPVREAAHGRDMPPEQAAATMDFVSQLLGRLQDNAPDQAYNPQADQLRKARESIRSIVSGVRPLGPPALDMAVMFDQPGAAELLLQRGAARGNGGKDGRDALMAALKKGNIDIVRLLVQAGVSTRVEDYGTGTPPAGDPEDPEKLAAIIVGSAASATAPNVDMLIPVLAAKLAEYPAAARPLFAAVRALAYDLVTSVGSGALPGAPRPSLISGQPLPPLPPSPASGPEAEDLSGEGVEFMFEEMNEMIEAREERIQTLLDTGRCAVREERPFADVVAELLAEMGRLDRRLASLLAPGLPGDEIARLWARTRSPLPSAVVDYFGRVDGVANPGHFDLFRGYAAWSLDTALVRNNDMREFKPFHYFTIMENIFGCAIQMDIREDASRRGLVYEVDEHEFVHVTVYPSPGAFFAALTSCFRRGYFRIVPGVAADGGRMPDRLVGDHDRVDAAFGDYALRIPGEQDVFGDGLPGEVMDGETGDAAGEVSDYDYSMELPG